MSDAIVKVMCGHTVTFALEDELLRVQFIGRVTYPNLCSFKEELYNDPDYDQNSDVLIEMGAARFDLSYTDLFHYSNTISKDPRRILGATALVSPSLLHYGIGRMYSGIVGDRLGKLRIERSLEPALTWLKAQRQLQPTA